MALDQPFALRVLERDDRISATVGEITSPNPGCVSFKRVLEFLAVGPAGTQVDAFEIALQLDIDHAGDGIEPGDKVRLAITINGKPVRALLDSGAGRSLLGMAEAAKLGVTPESPGALPAGCVGGFGKNAVDSWTAQFESFAIGDEVIHNPRIRFGDLSQHASDAQAEMLLGADFLHSHRVLIARSQRKLYFTYAGGTVFARPPAARACGIPSR